MKWLFLLAQDAQAQVSAAHYQFVPYKFGPFSFTLYQAAAPSGGLASVGFGKFFKRREGTRFPVAAGWTASASVIP